MSGLVCREYTACILTRDTHEHRKSCTGTDEYRIKAFLFHQLIDLYGFTDDNVGLDIHTECFYVFYLGCLQPLSFGRRNSGIP